MQVVFRLHESFKTPLREVQSQPYELTEHGWGEFDIGATVRAVPCTISVHGMHPADKPPLRRSTSDQRPASSLWRSRTSSGSLQMQILRA